jgi:hypothetical protein
VAAIEEATAAAEHLLVLVYNELRRLAASRLAQEASGRRSNHGAGHSVAAPGW